jgi:hypothetical protein
MVDIIGKNTIWKITPYTVLSPLISCLVHNQCTLENALFKPKSTESCISTKTIENSFQREEEGKYDRL